MRIIGSKACNNCNIVGDGGVAWRGVRQLDPRIGYYIYETDLSAILHCPVILLSSDPHSPRIAEISAVNSADCLLEDKESDREDFLAVDCRLEL
jgi:hypothetical protein